MSYLSNISVYCCSGNVECNIKKTVKDIILTRFAVFRNWLRIRLTSIWHQLACYRNQYSSSASFLCNIRTAKSTIVDCSLAKQCDPTVQIFNLHAGKRQCLFKLLYYLKWRCETFPELWSCTCILWLYFTQQTSITNNFLNTELYLFRAARRSY